MKQKRLKGVDRKKKTDKIVFDVWNFLDIIRFQCYEDYFFFHISNASIGMALNA